ncbi:MAG TPA: 7-cyano-7-deazaguanine synthase [Candidatus Anoxymicrobiaceae bacterium]|jgi:7-cyano-7-deazaguanine synthase
MRSLVLLSGGMDSAVCLYRAAADCGAERVEAIFFDWGQRSLAEELAAARSLCKDAGVAEPFLIELDFPCGGALTEPGVDIPTGRTPLEIAASGTADTFVPGRNLVMLTHAFGVAASRGDGRIYFGPNADDAAGYPDCRLECLLVLADACRLGTETGVELALPLIEMSKQQVVDAGDELGVPWEKTFSCYAPVDGRHCGTCDSCVLRLSALNRRG